MALTYPIAFVSKAPASERLGLERRQTVAESPFTYAQTIIDTAARWTLEWTFAKMRHADAERVAAWLLSLKGQAGSFRYTPRQSVQSALAGRTVAQAAFAYNDTLLAGGWGAGEGSGLRTGQFVSIGSQLLRLTSASAFADASGRVTITFDPALRINVPAGAAIEVANPVGVFRLTEAFGAFSLDPDRGCDFGTLAAREVV